MRSPGVTANLVISDEFLVLDGDCFGVLTATSVLVVLSPRLPLIPLRQRNTLHINALSKEGNQVVP